MRFQFKIVFSLGNPQKSNLLSNVVFLTDYIKLNISLNYNILYLTLKRINRVFPFKHFAKQQQVLYNDGVIPKLTGSGKCTFFLTAEFI